MIITTTPTTSPKPKPDLAEIGFGTHMTDHLFKVHYAAPTGWTDARIEAYGPLSLDPAAISLHYGQSIFEGLKIFRQPDGGLALFRPAENARRLNASAARIGMPDLPEEIFLDGLRTLVALDRDWAPDRPGYTLYARPVMIATQAILGVQPSAEHLFFILLTPTPSYFQPGQKGVRLWADRTYARTAPYTVAAAKTAGNYAKIVMPLDAVRAQGYDNILWLDGIERRRIEEVGITNIFVVYADHVSTPPLNGRILPGVTRDSVMTLIRDRDLAVIEEETDIDDLCAGIDSGRISEVFLTGTATVVAPVSSITFDQREYTLTGQPTLSTELYERLISIQTGRVDDKFGWLSRV